MPNIKCAECGLNFHPKNMEYIDEADIWVCNRCYKQIKKPFKKDPLAFNIDDIDLLDNATDEDLSSLF